MSAKLRLAASARTSVRALFFYGEMEGETMSPTRGRRIKFAAAAVLFAAPLIGRRASAEVTLLKNDEWDIYTTGRVNAFVSYGWGDQEPIGGGMGHNQIPTGGGLETAGVAVGVVTPGVDGMPDTTSQGRFSSWRVRSGFVPNVFGLGLRHSITETTKVEGYVAIWSVIEPEFQRKTTINLTNMQEGWARVTGSWGSVLAGRALDLFSRGATENDFLYGHGYSVGFPGNIIGSGPAAGMIGFGVIAAFFSPGIVYATPDLAGLKLNVGIYDPSVLAGGFEVTRTPRGEGELTYDLTAGNFKTHLFGNGVYQKVYLSGRDDGSQTAAGYGFGGRFEYGPVHLGVAGHRGKGLGIHYALEAGLINWDEQKNLRVQDGYSVLAQYASGPVDVNVGWGIARVSLTDLDKQPTMTPVSVLKQETAFSGGLVWHATPNVHASVDVLLGNAKWYLGETQAFNFVNTGMTFTW